MNRQERIELYGSPSFKYKPSISADGTEVIAPAENSSEAKYLPFDYLAIQNDSNVDIEIKVNSSSDDTFIVKAGTSRVLEKGKITSYASLKLINLSSSTAISSGELVINSKKEGMTADKFALKQAQMTQPQRVVKQFTGLWLGR